MQRNWNFMKDMRIGHKKRDYAETCRNNYAEIVLIKNLSILYRGIFFRWLYIVNEKMELI